MWCYVSFLQPGIHPCLLSRLPRCSRSQLRLYSALITLTHFSAHVHPHAHAHTNEHLQAKLAHSYKVRLRPTYVPSVISALLSLFVSQLHRCFSHGDMNTKFVQILFPRRLVGTVGFEMIMNLWARISHMAPCLCGNRRNRIRQPWKAAA